MYDAARRLSSSTLLGIGLSALLALLVTGPAAATDDHLLLCEAVVTPTLSEFIEIVNPTGAPVDLTNYYLSDFEDYAVLPGAFGAGPAPVIGSSDFIAQFPPGASIPAGGVIVVAFDGAGFLAGFGFAADFEIKGTDSTPDMIATNVGSTAGLTNGGENAVLFFWDGASDLVADVDMVNIGIPSSTNDIGDKSGVSVDGPDADSVASMYLADAFTMPQQGGAPGFGASTKRIGFETGNEAAGAGNGITGDDETSENIAVSWDSPSFSPPNPGVCDILSPPEPELVINEIDYDQPTPPTSDSAEFIELKNTGAVAVDLDPYEIVIINGDAGGATVATTLQLPSVILAPGDYYVVCGDAANVDNCDLDVTPNTNLIQNGAPDAVALVLSGVVIDTVSYEGDTGAPYTEGSGSGLEDPGSGGVGGGNDDKGISRFPDGVDTNQNNLDLSTRCITPGAANTADTESCGVVPEPGALVINEIDYDMPTPPTSDSAEFVEIKNTGASAVDLGTYELRFVNGNGGTIYATIPLPSVSLAAGDYFVVCGDAANVFNCDLDSSPDVNFIQNGSPDAVAIFQGSTLIDTVSYEGDTVAPYTEGSGSGLEDPGSGGVGGGNDNKGISRFPDGVDTDVNNVDLSTRCITPGAANSSAGSDCAAPGPPALVVNEIDYDMPGSGDSAEFVEIKNVGAGSASLAGVELLLVNGSGGGATIYNTIALPGVNLAAGGYFVVCGNAANVANCDLDSSPNVDFIQNGPPDAVALRFEGAILDTVSYEGDTGAPYTEGSGSGLEDNAGSGNANKGISRFPDGFDSDLNNADLIFVCITPGGANTDRTTNCSPTGPVLEIWEIQGSGLSSPFESSAVTTQSNVVTALGVDGFFMQTPAARTDGDVATSDGIFVFTGAAPAVSVGDLVDVAGSVQEFFAFTEIGFGASVTVTGTGALPAAVTFDATVPSPDPMTPSCGLFEYECYEGMLVEIADGTVTGPNQRFGTDPIAEVHITAAPARTFREEGIQFPGLFGLPVWDGNPEVFELDPDKLGLPNQIIPAGSPFSAVGVIGFEFGGYELWPSALTFVPAPLPVPVRPRAPGEFTVGSLNVFRLFDDFDDPADGDGRNDTVVSAAEYARRLAKFSAYIREVLGSPDILAVQEAEKLGVLEDLAALIELDDPGVVYTAYLEEGNDVGTIDVGFLVRDKIQVDAITQIDPDATFFNPVSMTDDILHDRPPLLLEGSCQLEFGSYPIAVMAVHNRSLGSIEDPVQGVRVRKKRHLQAVSIADKVDELQTADPDIRLVVTGDFNAYEFTDGYADAVGVITGTFVPADNLVCDEDPALCTGLADNDLFDQVLALPEAERYSFIFGGSAQVLDHALTSVGLDAEITGAEYGRGNADAAVDLINDDVTPANLALRSSDHDGLVVYITKDEDADGVPNDDDVCPDTVKPEGVPTQGLGTNRYALTDGDGVFNTVEPNGNGPGDVFTLGDTAGCSCEQIIAAQGLGNGHVKHGCSLGAMRNWVDLVNP